MEVMPIGQYQLESAREGHFVVTLATHKSILLTSSRVTTPGSNIMSNSSVPGLTLLSILQKNNAFFLNVLSRIHNMSGTMTVFA